MEIASFTLVFESGSAITTAIISISSFLAVAERQNFALLVEPVLSPVAYSYWRSSLLVFVRPNSLVPFAVVWVIFSIQMVEYS